MGADEILKRFKPVIVLEVNQKCLARYSLTQDHVYSTIKGLGYCWAELDEKNGPHSEQRDIICHPL
jgi:hypothetical protein